jgi:hypothetical protein
LLWCHRRGVAVELIAADEDRVELDGAVVSPRAAREALRQG